MKLTHINEKGYAKMVDVGDKENTTRTATAYGKITMREETLNRIINGDMKKGDVIAVAQVAGIMGAKNTSQTIPMCHTILLNGVDLEFEPDLYNNALSVTCTARCTGKTGVEMEALTGVSTALLTVYDMCKAIDKDMLIGEICLLEKTGGKSGNYRRDKGIETPESK